MARSMRRSSYVDLMAAKVSRVSISHLRMEQRLANEVEKRADLRQVYEIEKRLAERKARALMNRQREQQPAPVCGCALRNGGDECIRLPASWAHAGIVAERWLRQRFWHFCVFSSPPHTCLLPDFFDTDPSCRRR
jgi:hypothetical protein